MQTFCIFIQLLLAILITRPSYILSYTIKPIVYTGLALRLLRSFSLCKCVSFYPLITGLGYAFIHKSSKRFCLTRLFQRSATFLYRQSLKSSSHIIFQNPDDLEEFSRLQILPHSIPCSVIRSSGVDLASYPPSPVPSSPNFLMLSRLIVEKGIIEYVKSAAIVKQIYPEAKFLLAGLIETSLSSISIDDVYSWVEQDLIEYLGDLSDVLPALNSCRFFVLPSYREGTPRSVLEAMSVGRPIITTDVPGCRETVVHGVNGLLVPPRDVKALAQSMLSLIAQSDVDTNRMARASIELVRDRFDVHKVNAQLFNTMGL